MIKETLRKIGLSEGEITVYSSLIDFGASTVNDIHEKTGIERRNIYDILNKLIERGLVTYITENKRKFFRTSHPMKITGYLEEKESEIRDIKEEIREEIPSLIKKFEVNRPKISAEVYRGADGIKAVWEDMLNYKEGYWIGAGRYVPKKFPVFFANWDRRRVKLKIKWFTLLRAELKKEIKKPLRLEQMKFLPERFSGNPTVIGIFGNKVVNLLYLSDEFFAFVIENKELAEDYKRYHKYLWERVASRR